MNLGPAIRASLLGAPAIVEDLALWHNFPSVHTRRPLPDDVIYPAIAVSPNVAAVDIDFLTSRKQSIVRDVIVYGQQPEQYRVVESISELVRDHFHRNKFSLEIDGYRVIRIIASGPIPAPTDDDTLVARVVILTVDIQPTG